MRLRQASCAVVLALAACTPPGVGGDNAPQSTQKLASGQFDGSYSGTIATLGNNDPVCGMGSTAIRLRVTGDTIREGHKHSRHRLDGTITADGSFTLRDADNERVITGTIAGNTLSGSQTAIRNSADTLRTTVTCNATITATRHATSASDDAE